MEEPVTIKYRWTVDELLMAQRFNFRHSCRPALRFARYFIFFLMIVAGYGVVNDGHRAFGIVLSLLGVYLLAIRPFVRPWEIRRAFAKRTDKDLELEWQVTSENISVRSTAHSADYTWPLVGKVVQTPKGMLIYSSDQMFQWLPRHGFADDHEFQRMAGIARSKVKRFYQVT